jgi:uncharacterized membrane protein YgcG
LHSAAVAQQRDVKSSNAPGIHIYAAPDGETYFSLGLKADAADVGKRINRDHVILVDTSASQFGEHRTQAFAVLKTFLAELPAGDRVSLFAVDVAAKQLSAGFVAPHGKAIDLALSALNRRFPAGATNLSAAINAGLKTLDANRPGSLVYIGDGMSTANLLQQADLQSLLGELRDRQVPMHSYAVGPQTDLQLLGIIGQQTGGVVLFDSHAESQKEKQGSPVVAGRRLAAAVDLPVYYPQTIEVSQADLKLLPNIALPLRSDRETIYLGKGTLPQALDVVVSDEKKSLRWHVVISKAGQAGNTFLGAMWNRANKDQGLSVGLAGRELFGAAQDAFENQVNSLAQAGERAIAVHDLAQAEEIGLAIKQIDPLNVRAAALIGAARKKALKIQTVTQVVVQPPAQPADAAAQPAADDLKPRQEAPTPAQLDLLDELERIRIIREQQMRLRVQNTIQFARQIASGDPNAAISELKRVEEAVRTLDIDPDARQQMLKTLRSVRYDVVAQREVSELKSIQAQSRRAQDEAQQRLLDALVREEEKIEQLIDQVRALIEEGVHGNDDAYEEAEAVARAVVDIRPGNAAAAAAVFSSEAAGQLNKAFRLRSLRANRFLEVLYQVELSHVPFPDEPPIRWPAAEVWKALTERRAKWASVDLHKNSPAEERIQAALSETTEVEFVDTSLTDAMEFLADLHDITIILNETALSEEGIASDEPITQVLSGISLRSTLKIILEPLGLTYIIEDEVMKITTEIDAEEQLSTRVYPVGDLVIPIMNPQAGGLGQGLGGVGGLGGGGLGGGGQFGAGSTSFGGGGQGGGGQGGGLFSLPPAKFPLGKKNVSPKVKPLQDAEVQQLLNGILKQDKTSQVNRPVGQAFAQVKDPLPKKPFRFDNKTIESIKSKKKRDR